MKEQLIETWDIHQRIHLYMLDAIDEPALAGLLASKGRNVGEQFAHIHNVRLMWLQSAAPSSLTSLKKVDKSEAIHKAALVTALKASAAAVRTLLESALSTDLRIKGFKPHAVAWLGYIVAHESHHRGQIALALKQSGHPLDKKTAFGLWEWGAR